MKEYKNYPEKNHFLARLSHLAALQGLPHWSFDGRDQNSQIHQSPASARKSHSAVRALFNTLQDKARNLLAWIAEERQFRQNIRELRSLNDRALRDIGIHRGDIAALVSREHPAEELNALRETLARPACIVLEFAPEKSTQSSSVERQLVDNAA